MATRKPLIPPEELPRGRTPAEWQAWTRAYLASAGERGGCDVCRFENIFGDLSEPLCTLPDISKEDFALGVAGVNCSRFQPRKRV
jgi:hypothetical protein